ncbi:hypothetical protein [Actinacidiphila guanduensis]|uniref:Uncharacterized protein n=1 Tax=Actinacidiphila guanduensis TaxID=310781 RepID=A0A1H0G8B7_9ACTN|nr:hypothetical protein [Actinacidiphila guanduensis]SDO03145.1 hypothetical protein SAMN05216259_10727 [Actinacidiphila guanduensis]
MSGGDADDSGQPGGRGARPVGPNPHVNEGIIVTGGRIEHSAVAAGRGASARLDARQVAEPLYAEAVRAMLAEVRRHLDAMADEGAPVTPEQRTEAMAEADAIEQELRAEPGDDPAAAGQRLTGRLRRLGAFVSGATALLGLVRSAEETVRAVIGQ